MQTSLKIQARRVDSVDGGRVLLVFGRYILAPEAQASRACLGACPPPPPPPQGNFANLDSLKCNFLHFEIVTEVGCIFLEY